jgi:hypothetical protein
LAIARVDCTLVRLTTSKVEGIIDLGIKLAKRKFINNMREIDLYTEGQSIERFFV